MQGTRFPWRALLLVALLSSAPAPRAATSSPPPSATTDAALQGDTARARAYDLGQIWAHVQFLHPALADAKTSRAWDQAFADAVPALLAAPDDAAYVDGVARLLATLDDPLTDIVPVPPPVTARQPADPGLRDEGGTLVVDLRDPGSWPTWADVTTRWAKVVERVGQSSRVVVDLRARQPVAPEDYYMLSFSVVHSGLGNALGCIGLTGPVQRSRMYTGLPPEGGGDMSGYSHAFRQSTPDAIAPIPSFGPSPPPPARPPFAVFIVDPQTIVPDCMTALAQAGRAAVVAVGGPGSNAANLFVDLPVTATRQARVRLSQSFSATGAPWQAAARLVDDDEQALAVALALAREGKATAATGSTTAIVQPRFTPEYPKDPVPGIGWRVIAMAKTCFVGAHFFPYRDLTDEPWLPACRQAYGPLLAAKDVESYRMALHRQLLRFNDAHAGMQQPHTIAMQQSARPPIEVRLVEGKALVTRLGKGAPKGLAVGDEIVTVDGRSAADRMADVRALSANPTPQRQDSIATLRLLTGETGTRVRFTAVDSRGKRRDYTVTREAPLAVAEALRTQTLHFRLLDEHTGYANLEELRPDEVEAMFTAFAGVHELVLDLRGYPQGTAWAIAPHLTDRSGVPAARIDVPEVFAGNFVATPIERGTSTTSFLQALPAPIAPTWRGRVAVLIDERAMSQAEHSALFFKAATNVEFFGGPTVGTNGNITQYRVPGDITVSLTGLSVRWPDGTQLQRRGVQPDHRVTPTVAGVRAGRDEVLDAALAWLAQQRGD